MLHTNVELPSRESPLRVAIIGAGPAGIYAADALMKSSLGKHGAISIDLYEKMPAPFGLIRYGVAPDHPRIKGIITALHKILDKPHVRLLGNVEYGRDIHLADLLQFYSAIIFSTGAIADRPLSIPGIDLNGSFGAAEFVAWYDGHPDFPREWSLTADKVAVIGVGNVALDVARILAKTADELLPTEIPDNVYTGLKANKAQEVHIFGRRGPAQVKFTPLELKELDHSPSIEVIIDPADIDYDEASEKARRESKITDQVASIIEEYAIRDIGNRPHKLFIHLFHSPVEVLGNNGVVTGLKTERTELDGNGNVRGTGEFHEWELSAVYRAVGYLSHPLPDIPFDNATGVIPNIAGRIIDESGNALPQLYTTGWIKRGPVGLIGHTKGDANETIECLLTDLAEGKLPSPPQPCPDSVLQWLNTTGISYTTWEGWHRLDEKERALGALHGRERIKIVEREDMLAASEPEKVL